MTEHDSRRITGMLSSLCDTATDLIRAASAAERAAWLEDARGLAEASERVAALSGLYRERYASLLAARGEADHPRSGT